MNRMLSAVAGVAAFASVGLLSTESRACGDSEAPVSCDAENAGTAMWMLKRVVSAVRRDEAGSLAKFAHGEGGFRTADTYVFCMNTIDSLMSAHPDPKLMGQNARDLVDPKGKHFAAEMLDNARPDKITEVDYLFPRLGSSVPVPKTSYVTRIGNQVCGVGYYDQIGAAAAVEPAAPSTADQLQALLDRDIPAALKPVWRDFIKAHDTERSELKARTARVLEQLKQVETLLDTEATPSR